ncbi:hypothetical protein [Catellatospora methionotrophica]|nr:hypothetical protein [Catellatospora methionotrophica]
MLRRLAVPLAFLTPLALIAACGPATATSESTPATSAPALLAPSATDGGAAHGLRDRYAATQRLAGLAEMPEHSDEKLDYDGVVCGRPVPLLDRRLAAVVHAFGTPDDAEPQDFANVNQETVVYTSEADATEALRQLFDLLDECERDVEADQVTDGHAAVELPNEVGLPGRAVAATMTIPEGYRFPYRYGCLRHTRVVQCVAVWTRSVEHTATWFDKAIIVTAEGLRT